MKIKTVFSALILLLAGMVSGNVFAGSMTCGGPERIGTLTSDGDVLDCRAGTGNATASTVNGYYGDASTVYVEVDDDTGSGDEGLLNVWSDDWGTIPINGEWSIDAEFWTMYDSAVISIHIGNGGGESDHWAWLLDSGASSGSWEITCGPCSGGGLSNVKLYGVRGASVPAPGAAFLLGLGLIGLVGMRKKIS